MKKTIQISVPTPCHEDWQQMTLADKGRFCASCQTKVIDFTNSSDREIARTLEGSTHVCGRFRESQLNRELTLPKEKSTIWIAASAAVVSLFALGTETISAQTVTTEQYQPQGNIIVGKPAPPQRRIIAGMVSDEAGALPGALIKIKGSDANIVSDIDGKYSIGINENDILIFSFVGYDTIEVPVSGKKEIDVVLSAELMVVGMVRQRPFFGRIFQSIGNLFR